MAIAAGTITKTGQVTIPKSIREILGVDISDQIAFLSDGKRVELIAVPKNPLSLKSKEEFRKEVELAELQKVQGRFTVLGGPENRVAQVSC
ncbi:AbrB/MazE/SpoVT family DNA-binding domain-containing protein [Atopobium fossor]|uniref:AbrB/MazE/SpoVT family DNA-binding domain-containing protein n=1 Tax=Atopobium fossor TaxID=39487 RepID=UPI00041FD2EA|nr:AbrB/MazE/SpoVT family DNA-binding domain-containing protein [Atopobium fossor]